MYDSSTNLEAEFEVRGPEYTRFRGKKIGRFLLCVWGNDSSCLDKCSLFNCEIRYHCAIMPYGRQIQDKKDEQTLMDLNLNPYRDVEVGREGLLNLMNTLLIIMKNEETKDG